MASGVAASLPTLFQGCFKKRTDGTSERLPELRVAPPLLASANNTYQVLATRLFRDLRNEPTAQTTWDGSASRFDVLEYQDVSVSTKPYHVDGVRVSRNVLRELERNNPDLRVLDTALQFVESKLAYEVGALLSTGVAALSAGTAMDLTSASTSVLSALETDIETIHLATGHRPNVWAVGPAVARRLRTTNTEARMQAGAGGVGGATAGRVEMGALREWLRASVGVELVVIDRVYGTAAGANAYQWTTTAALVHAAGDDMPSCFKFCHAVDGVFEFYTDELRRFEGGGNVIGAEGVFGLATVDSSLGLKQAMTV